MSFSATDANAEFLSQPVVENKSAFINQAIEAFRTEQLRKEAEDYFSQPLTEEDKQWVEADLCDVSSIDQ